MTGPSGPVSGAEVIVWVPRPGPFGYHESVTTKTAEDGIWSLGCLAKGVVGVKVVAEGLLHSPWGYDPRESWGPDRGDFPEAARCRVDTEDATNFDVVLVPAPVYETSLCLSGCVRDEEGKPIPLARVIANDSETTTTDARGGFSFDVLCDSRWYASLDAMKRGYETKGWSATLTAGRSDIEIVLPRTRVIRGRVVSKSGAEVAGAIVHVGRESNVHSINYMHVDTAWDEENPARVGPDGCFEVKVLEPRRPLFPGSHLGDEFVVCVQVKGHRPAYSELLTFKDDCRVIETSLTIEPSFEVRGHVVREATGEPLAGAAVRLERGPGGWPPKWPPGPWEGVLVAVTDLRGDFLLTDLGPGRHEVDVSFPGLESAGWSIDVPTDESHCYELRSYRSLGGVVLDPEGRPVVGAEIILHDEETGFPFLTDQATDEDGRFHLDRVPDLSVYVLAHPDAEKHPALGPASVGPIEDEDHSLKIVLPEGLEIRGRLLDAEGRGLVGIRVEGAARVPFHVSSETTTDDEGRFRLRGLAPGHYNLGFLDAEREFLKVAPADPYFASPGACGQFAFGSASGGIRIFFTTDRSISFSSRVRTSMNLRRRSGKAFR